MKTKYFCSGDRAITVSFGNDISEATNSKVVSMARGIERSGITGIVETVPGYNSLLVYFNPLEKSRNRLLEEFLELEMKLDESTDMKGRMIEIPVAYGGEFGPDLSRVAELNGLNEEEVVSIHSAGIYRVYMLGFTPGFPYLGGMDKSIAARRLDSPRLSVRAGSVGIADGQTGVYPVESPGGWNIVGRTPLELYRSDSESPVLLRAGDSIVFRAVSEAEYEQIERQIQNRSFICKTIDGEKV